MMRKTLFTIAAAALLVVPKVHAQTPVDIQLALLVDVSGSISNGEFNLQRTGYVDAFGAANSGFWNAFAASGRSLAVSFTYWSGASQQSQLGGNDNNVWYEIANASDAQDFSDAIAGFSRQYDGGTTAPGNAINFIAPRFATSGYNGTTKIIDVSGDGCRNSGVSDVKAAGDNAIANNDIDRINGLVIGTATNGCGSLSLSDWYAANIVNGGGFLESAGDFDDFGAAINRKIGREVGGTVPEPATMTLLATGLLAMAGASKRRRKNKS